jgi:beta-glucosidase
MLTAPDGLGVGFKLELFDAPACNGAPAVVQPLRESQWIDSGAFAAVEGGRVKSARITASYTPAENGPHQFGLLSAGYADLYVDGALVVENRQSWTAGETFYGFGSVERRASLDLQAGRAYAIEIRFDRKPKSMMKAVRFGVRPPQPADPLGHAVAVARASEAVVLVLGANSDWETEGHDRHSMRLPGDQDALARAVLAANPKTIVVLNIGAAVDMPWLSQARAVLVPWFAGQEFGAALADMLLGEAEPGGRLPFSWPAALEDSPGYRHYTREGLDMTYGEGLLMGYRGHCAHGPPALFPFGHGLGFSDIAIAAAKVCDGGVQLELHNRSDRAGETIVQIYADAPDPDYPHPIRRLCGFQRVGVAAQTSETVVLPIAAEALAQWSIAANALAQPAHGVRFFASLSGAEDPSLIAARMA